MEEPRQGGPQSLKWDTNPGGYYGDLHVQDESIVLALLEHGIPYAIPWYRVHTSHNLVLKHVQNILFPNCSPAPW